MSAMLAITSVSAQERCSSSAYFQKIKLQHPEITGKLSQISQSARRIRQSNVSISQLSTNAPAEILIPVIVHVVYNSNAENISDDQIKSQIEALNDDFNKTNLDFAKVPDAFKSLAGESKIRFVLAKSDPDGRATTGIIRKQSNTKMWSDDDHIKFDAYGGSNAWDADSYLNIWTGSMVGGLLGYASFPGGPADKDGVVIRSDVFGTRGKLAAPFNKGRTATHEVGHWLNLKHLWGDITCGDDEVFDTPVQRSHNTGCPSFPRINAGCANGANGDMFMNFMDFTNDACMGLFTIGQAFMMRSMFEEGMPREKILKSKGLNEPWNASAPVTSAPLTSGKMLLFPNPVSSSTITVEAVDGLNWVGQEYRIYNTSGQSIQSGKMTQEKQIVNISRLSAGIYYFKVGDAKAGTSTRFVKQ
jgi:Pregnancy-associated plasma protein-A/Secretion system C-terminal sorting domain